MLLAAISKGLFHLCGFAFVDDSDLIQDGESCPIIAADMQHAISLWEDVMNATGQAMEPSKSWWYLVDYSWKDGIWSFADGSMDKSLIAHDTDGTAVPLTRLKHDAATKMLGVYLSPHGDMKKELEYLREKAMVWSDFIRCGHLSKGETWVALSTYIWKTITYPLPVTTFSEAELSHIIWPILQVALPRMGLCRTIARELRYGPCNLGGLGLVDPFLEQGIRKIEYLAEHGWKQTPTGFLIQSCIEVLSLECGVFGELFTQKATLLQWISVDSSWLQSAWSFCSDKRISIAGIQKSPLTQQRCADKSLMSSFALQDISKRDLQRINCCRMFLRVTSLSDITTADGTRIDHADFLPSSTRIPAGGKIRNHFVWPTQRCPPLRDWKLWKRVVIDSFCTDDTCLLHTPLGEWLHPDVSRWDWYGEINDEGVYVKLWRNVYGTWKVYFPSSHRN